MNTPIQHTHDGTVITYNEANNKWTFTLRGRDRSAESLAKAKEFIDKPVPKAKPFEKIPAWLFKYEQDKPAKIEVTGIAEDRGYGGGQQVWINKAGARSKEGTSFSIYPQNEKNDQIAQQVIEKQKAIQKLREEIGDLKTKLSPLVLPKDE